MEVEFDRDKAMKKIRNDLKQEKRELKQILHDEFGLFREDQTDRGENKPADEPAFRFEFPGEESEPDTIPGETEKKRKWWQRRKQEDTKPDFDIVIDESER